MHIIFDLDGTLLDSEFEVSAITAAVAGEKGCVISAEEVFRHFSGLSAEAKFEGIAAQCGVTLSGDDIKGMVQRHEEAKAALVTEEEVAPTLITGAREVLEKLDKAGHVLSLASSSPSSHSKAALDKTGLRHHFNERVFGPDNSGGKLKPDPGIYIKAIAADAGDPVAVEDSVPGITAAHAAGAFVIARLDPRFGTGADIVIRDYADLEAHLPRQGKHNVSRLAA